MSASNSPPPPIATTTRTSKLRRALGITPGWGIGMSHSGTYTSTSNRTSSTLPVSTDVSATHMHGIKAIIRKKKTWEHAAIQDAKARQEERLAKANDLGMKEQDVSDVKARAAATAKAKRMRNELNKLFLQQAELEKGVQYSWKTKMEEYEAQSLREEKEVLDKLKREHDADIQDLEEKVRMENEQDEKKMAEEIAALKTGEHGNGNTKRKAESQGTQVGITDESSTHKKRKVEGVGESSQFESTQSSTETTSKCGDDTKATTTSTIIKNDNDGSSDTFEEKESTKQQKELDKIVEEMNYLNKTKSQMIWLLKQVITAEARQKMMQAKKK